jgi:hypothetical protein
LLKGLQKKFSLSPERAERLLQKVPVVVKKGLSRGDMEKYIRAFEEIGGKVKVEEEPEAPEAQEFQIPSMPPPEPGYGAVSEPEREPRPYTGRMITCPQWTGKPETDDCSNAGSSFRST